MCEHACEIIPASAACSTNTEADHNTLSCLTLELHNTVRHMTNRKHGKVSERMKKDFDNL